MRGVLVLSMAACISWVLKADSPDARALIEQGNAALEQGHFHEATEFFLKAIDLDPSSAKAHEQLGATISREIIAGNARPSADNDVVERAAGHLQAAIDLAPYATRPLIELSELEAVLAGRSDNSDERSDLELAKLERDEFSPVIQQAKARIGTKSGPLPDAQSRQSLQQQYGDLIEDAISNARKASEMKANSLPPLLLMSRLLKERAVLRDTPEQYASDMHSAADWQRQFLINRGHTGSGESR